MVVSNDSIGQLCITAQVSEETPVMSVCRYDDPNYIVPCDEDEDIEGVLIARRGDRGTLQVRGFVTLPYIGQTPCVGLCPLVTGESGNTVKTVQGKREYLVTDIDTVAKTVTFML